ncbi:MAG: hypothetical protein ACTHOG_02780, partial [Marmoricola sp.]
MSHVSARRWGALTAAALVATGVTAVAGPAQAAAVDPGPANAGAGWLTSRLQSNGLLASQYGTDYWTSADAAFAQFATDHATDGTNLVTALASNVDHYISNADYGYPNEYSAGSTAKALVLAKLAGIDPTNFGGVNLVTRLESLVASSGNSTGRIEDTVDPADQYGADYGNTLGQAFAVRALAEQGATTQAADALSYLLKQQCESGYFRIFFTNDKSATDQSCDGGLPTTGASYGDHSNPSVDATAYALIELKALPSADIDSTTARAIGKAEAWLEGVQNANGSWDDLPYSQDGSANADSTGLATWALGEWNDLQAAHAGAVWVRAHQAQNVGPCSSTADKLSEQAGAIAHDDAALASGRINGIPLAQAYSWNLSTAQAVPALSYYAPDAPATALKATATTAYVRAKTRTNVTVTGLRAGAPACVTLGTSSVSVAAGQNGTAVASVLLPAGTATRSISVTDGAMTTSTSVKVLDAKTFTLTPSTLRP